MALQVAPKAKDVQDFQFKLLARLRVFKGNQKQASKQAISLVANSSKYGLIFVGTVNGFDVIQTQRIVEQYAGVKQPAAEVSDYPRRSVSLGVEPSHLHVSCDGEQLAVGFTSQGSSVIRIYAVTSLTAQKEQVVSEVRLMSPLQEMCWNPGVPNLLATCQQDGSAAVYEFKANSFDISSIPVEAQATCLCWSPKGKQIVIGSKNGALNQFKPDLKIVKSIPPPQGCGSIVNVQWLGTVQYAAVYMTQTGPSLVIINTPKNQPITYQNYEDITYSSGDSRTVQFYFIHQLAWDVLLMSSANSMEVGVLGAESGAQWEQWLLEDSSRAELPFFNSHEETYPVGMTLDISPQYNMPIANVGESKSLGPMPLLVLLSTEGLLILYWAVNRLPNAKNICELPKPLTDTSGLHLFTSPQPQVEVQQVQQGQQGIGQSSAVTQSPGFSFPTQAVPPVSTQPFSTADPRLENKTATPGLWLNSTTSAAGFVTSLSHSAFSSTSVPAVASSTVTTAVSAAVPGLPSFTSTPTTSATLTFGSVTSNPPAFGSAPTLAASTAPPVFNLASSTPAFSSGLSISQPPTFSLAASAETKGATTSAPSFFLSSTPSTAASTQSFSFAPLPSSESSLKTGSFVSTSKGVAASQPSASPVATVAPTQAKIELPEAPPSLVSTPALAESEATEESEKLKAMNEALIENAMLEEIAHFELELNELGRRVRSIDLNVISDTVVKTLSSEVEDLSSFMLELQDTTRAQDLEVSSLQNFLLSSFSYIEGTKNRIRLQNNPDYVSIQSPLGLDPVQSRKLADIKSNLDIIEIQLGKVNGSLADKWIEFQDANKENRNSIQIPSMESLYQTMMMQSDMMMKQKLRLENMEAKIGVNNRKKLLSLLNVSQMMDESQPDVRDSEVSKIAQDFLSLNLRRNNHSTLDDLQLSISNLGVSDIYTPDHPNAERVKFISDILENIPTKYVTQKSSPDQETFISLTETIANATNTSSSQIILNSSKPSILGELEQRSKQTEQNQNALFSDQSSIQASMKTAVTIGTQSPNKHIIKEPISTHFSVLSKTSPGYVLSPTSESVNVLQNTTIKTPSTAAFTLNSSTNVVSPSSTQSTVFGTSDTKNIGFSFTSPTTTQSSKPLSFQKLLENTTLPQTVSSNKSTSPSQPISFQGNSSLSQPFPAQTSTPPFVSQNSPTQSLFSQKPSPSFSFQNATTNSQTFSFQTPITSAQPFSISNKPFSFSSVPTTSPAGFKSAQSSKDSPALVTAPSSPKLPPAVSVFPVTPTTSTAFSSPLGSLSALVSGIEPLKSENEIASPNKGFSFGSQFGSTKSNASESSNPSLFKISNSNGNNPIVSKQNENITLGFNVFGQSQNKQESNAKDTGNLQSGAEVKSQLGAFKNISFDSPPAKPVFGVATPSPKPVDLKQNESPKSLFTITPKVDETKTTQSVKSLFPTPQSTGIGNVFSPNSALQTQKPSTDTSTGIVLQSQTIRDTTSEVTSSDEKSPIIEITLTPTKSEIDINKTLEKIAVKDITISKVDSPSEKKDSKTQPSESNSSAGLSLDSFQTPTKSSQGIFGGSTPTKPLLMYEVAKTDNEKETQGEHEQVDKVPDTTTNKANVSSSFSFSMASIPVSTTSENNQTQPSTGFSFDLKLPATTTSALTVSSLTGSQNSSSFSFAQTTIASTTSSFSFSGPVTSTPPTTSVSSFGFGSLSFSDDKSKSGFSFSQPPQTTSSATSIFGGSSVQSSNIFGSTPSGASNSLFGQQSAETKNIFGGAPAKTESSSAFSFALQTTTATTQSSFFNSPSTTNASFFGQPICSPASTASSPFGQPSNTSVFGSAPSQPFGATPAFGGKPTFGQSGGSFFNQSSGFGASGGSLFGGNTTASAGSPSLFGGSAPQPASPFGQSAGTGGSIFGGSGSFTNSGQSVGQTGFGTPGFQNKPAGFGSSSPTAFGGSPSFGGAPTFGSAASFGSPPGKLFGSPTASPPPAFGGGNPQQSSTFGNLASQNTMTFGNLAQNQSPGGFGSGMFQQQQQQQPSAPAQPAFQPANTGPAFGGSSFSSWR